jgi:hypothetical protein
MKRVGLNFRNNLEGKHHNWKIESLMTRNKKKKEKIISPRLKRERVQLLKEQKKE